MYNIPNRILAGWIPSGVIRPKGSRSDSVVTIASASTPTFGSAYPVALYINASDGSTYVCGCGSITVMMLPLQRSSEALSFLYIGFIP